MPHFESPTDGFWSPSTLVYDAMRQGIAVLPPDINHSAADCAVQAGAIRIGLSYVKGLKSYRLEPLLAERARGAFVDLADFIRRVKLPLRLIERLIQAGALDRWHHLAPSIIVGCGPALQITRSLAPAAGNAQSRFAPADRARTPEYGVRFDRPIDPAPSHAVLPQVVRRAAHPA